MAGSVINYTLTQLDYYYIKKLIGSYGFITSSSLTGYLQASNNLSDVSNANTSLNNLLPSQTSNSGKVLQTNGTNTSWVTPSSTGTPFFQTIIVNSLRI